MFGCIQGVWARLLGKRPGPVGCQMPGVPRLNSNTTPHRRHTPPVCPTVAQIPIMGLVFRPMPKKGAFWMDAHKDRPGGTGPHTNKKCGPKYQPAVVAG